MPPTIDKSSNMVLVLRELKGRDLTPDGCAALLRMAKRNARRYLELLHAQRKVFISGWDVKEARPGPPPPIYSLGRGVDKPRPAIPTPAARRARCRARKRQVKPEHVKRDPLVLALFGKKKRRRK